MRNFNLSLQCFLDYLTGETECSAVVALATAIVLIATSFMAFLYAKRSGKSKQEGLFTRSISLGALHGGKLALERLVKFHQARADAASLNAAGFELKALLAEEHPDFNKLQSAVSKLEMSGKEIVAIDVLQSEVEKARKEKKPHEAYEIEMLLVEMLIYKGDYEKALTCECLSHELISDARRPLYKAIIHIMLEHPKEEASKCWEEFTEIRTHFLSPPSFQEDQVYTTAITHFDEFENVVKMLKKDINEAHTRRSQSSKTK